MTQFKNLPVLKIGDRVTFDTDQIELFKAETSSEDKAVKQYQQLVLGGVDQVESWKNWVVISLRYHIPTDGITGSTKYLIVLP